MRCLSRTIAGLLFSVVSFGAFAATVLMPGDIVILTVNSESGYANVPNNNAFDFVSKVDLDAGTIIYFADKGWDGSLATPFWRNTTGEGALRYTVPSGGIPAGTIIHYDDTLSAHPLPTSGSSMWDMYSINAITGTLTLTPTSTSTSLFDPAAGGDNILVFQDPTNTNSAAAPNFIYGIGWAAATTWITSGGPTSNNSYLPTSLSLGTTAVSLGSTKNYQYNCSNVNFNSGTFLSDLATIGNWNSQQGTTGSPLQYGISPCSIIVDTLPPTVTQFTSTTTDGTYGPGSSVNISATLSESVTGGTITATLSNGVTVTLTCTASTNTCTGSYTVGATGSGQDTSDLTVSSFTSTGISDTVGNVMVSTTLPSAPNNLGDSKALVIDTTAPTIAVTSSDTAPLITGESTTLTFTLSEPSSTFALADITVAGGTLSAFTAVSSTEYTVILTPTANSTTSATIDVTASTFTDAVGNPNTALTQLSLTVDTLPPTLTSFTSSTLDGTYGPGSIISFTATLSENVSGGSLTVSLNNGVTTTLTCTAASTTCTGSYTVGATGSGQDTSDLTVSSFTSTGIADTVGNVMVSTTLPSAPNNLGDSKALVVDTTAPSAPVITTPVVSFTAATGAPVTVSGTCETGATVSLTNSTMTAPTTRTTLCTGGVYTFTISWPVAAQGSQTITLTQTDPSGNVSPQTTRTLSVVYYGGGGGSTSVIETPVVTPVPVTPPVEDIAPEEASPTSSESTSTCQGPNSVNQWYRLCTLGTDLTTFKDFKDNILCEKFIIPRTEESSYEYQKTAPRKEVLAVAVSMLRNNSNHDTQAKDHIFQDLGLPYQSSWILPTVQVGLYQKLITPNRDTFEPDRDVTRAEAYAMVMSAVCLYPTGPTEDSWQQKLHAVALKEGLTQYTWNTFESERPILRQELFVLASRASDWAERTGGCTPKPAACLSQ